MNKDECQSGKERQTLTAPKPRIKVKENPTRITTYRERGIDARRSLRP